MPSLTAGFPAIVCLVNMDLQTALLTKPLKKISTPTRLNLYAKTTKESYLATWQGVMMKSCLCCWGDFFGSNMMINITK